MNKNYYQIFAALFAIILISGCVARIPHSIDRKYSEKAPRTIVVLPPLNKSGDASAQAIMRRLVDTKVRDYGYSTIPNKAVIEKVTEIAKNRKSTVKRITSSKSSKNIREIAEKTGADAVLLTTITDWDRKDRMMYVSFSVAAQFALYQGSTGKRLWRSRNDFNDRKIGLERDALRLTEHFSLEPFAEKVVDSSFSTLPRRVIPKEEEEAKEFFYWLK